MGPTPGQWVHLMHTKRKANKKKAKCSIHWLLLSVMAKMKVKVLKWDLMLNQDAKSTSDVGQSKR